MRRLLLTILALAGCAGLPVQTAADLTDRALAVLPEFREAGYQVQRIVPYYQAKDVKHVVIKLFTVSGGAETAAAGKAGDFSQDLAPDTTTPITFGGLKGNTTYRVRAYAYKATGTAASDKISDDASSSIDVTVTDDDRPTLAKVPVQLLGATFSAEATTTVSVTDGTIEDAASESLKVIAP